MSMTTLHTGIINRLTVATVATVSENQPVEQMKIEYVRTMCNLIDSRHGPFTCAYDRETWNVYREEILSQLADVEETLAEPDGDLGDAPEVLESLADDMESKGSDFYYVTYWEGGAIVYDTLKLLPIDVFYLRGEWDPDKDSLNRGRIDHFHADMLSVNCTIDDSGIPEYSIVTGAGEGAPMRLYVNGRLIVGTDPIPDCGHNDTSLVDGDTVHCNDCGTDFPHGTV